MSIDWHKLKIEAEKVMNNAYAPYSNHRVAAALLTEKGNVYTGVNVENSSYGLTICAERTAVFKAVTAGEREFEAILIFSSGKKPAYPCGACRQVLSEFSPDISIGVVNERGEVETSRLSELLPYAFKFERKA